MLVVNELNTFGLAQVRRKEIVYRESRLQFLRKSVLLLRWLLLALEVGETLDVNAKALVGRSQQLRRF